jgi:hypothetical protein
MAIQRQQHGNDMANGNCDVIVIVISRELSGSSRVPALDVPRMSSASASSSFPVAPQGAKRGDVPGCNNLKVATYNIGAKAEEAFQGALKATFRAKLKSDIKDLLDQGIHVLCLQEVSKKWEDEIVGNMLPNGWKVASAANCLIAFHSPSWKRVVNTKEVWFSRTKRTEKA